MDDVGDMTFKQVTIYMGKNTKQRVIRRHFRGVDQAIASNISEWLEPRECFRDAAVQKGLLNAVNAAEDPCNGEVIRCTIVFQHPIGWLGADKFVHYYEKEDLEPFNINAHATGLRVKSSMKSILAPKANELTIVFRIFSDLREGRENDGVIEIVTMYPGEDVGPLEGDISKNAPCVFFGWDHPGKP